MHLRLSNAGDIPTILAIQQQAPMLSQWSQSLYEDIFLENSTRIALVAEDNEVEAFAVARDLGEEWEIENIAVASRARRKGAATLLLAEITRHAWARGARAIFLEVRESNYPARRLYEKENFAVAGRRPAYYAAPVEDAIVYRRSLL
jgi:[ribosomal protein S18]-alanine N-acetyltransferase